MNRITLAAIALLLLAGQSGSQGPGFGSQMIEVGYRFSMAGKAGESQNFALAEYELDELGEAMTRLQTTRLPEDLPKGVNVVGLLDAYQRTTLAELRKMARKKDLRAFRNAYATAVAQCNACHKQVDKVFLKVPSIPQGATFLDLKP